MGGKTPAVGQQITIRFDQPRVGAGGFAKAIVGRPIRVGATVFRDGHGVLGARVKWRAVGQRRWQSAPLRADVDDRWSADIVLDQIGAFELEVEAWTRRYATWRRDVERWLSVGEDIDAELLVGAELLDELAPLLPAAKRRRLASAQDTMRATGCAQRVRLDAGFDDAVVAIVDAIADPADLSTSPRVRVQVERERAAVGAWYEFFPRSEGGLVGARARLADIAAMGFDVVYLPPVHPIGVTGRKGPDNSPTARPGDVGSPWAIGAAAGGHDAIEPSLGTLADFDAFVTAAAELDLEVAMDIALQCSPDHPWVTQHPEWFRRRSDGSIRYAENPPKRYQDIFPLEFWPGEPHREALWDACAGIFEFWIDRGIRIFRVDNPHTKPLAFWQWLIARVWARTPDVVFLAEAFTRPAMMHALAEVGFSQSYTYFTWRDDPAGIRSYVDELAFGPDRDMFRPNFWPTTPDILAGVLRNGSRAAFELRAVLAALLSPSWGIYSGYELLENRPASPDNEEFAQSEKYQVVTRSWKRAGNLAPLLTRLNAIRRSDPDAFGRLDTVRFHHVDHPSMLAWSRGAVLCVANFDTATAQEATVYLDDVGVFGVSNPGSYQVTDLLDPKEPTYLWRGGANYVRLDPAVRAAHVFRLHDR